VCCREGARHAGGFHKEGALGFCGPIGHARLLPARALSARFLAWLFRASRDAGSAEIDLDTLKLSWLGLERAATHGNAPDIYRPLADATMALIQRLRALAGDAGPGVWRAAGFETQERVWAGREVSGCSGDWDGRAWAGGACWQAAGGPAVRPCCVDAAHGR
jgi:hypothetical protein